MDEKFNNINGFILAGGKSSRMGKDKALRHTDLELNFIVSCEMPYINKDGIQYIIQNSIHSQITVPEKDGITEPLVGVYSKDCLNKWTQLIQQRKIKLQEMILHFKLNIINVNDNILFDNNFFMNINTKKDLDNAINLTNNGN